MMTVQTSKRTRQHPRTTPDKPSIAASRKRFNEDYHKVLNHFSITRNDWRDATPTQRKLWRNAVNEMSTEVPEKDTFTHPELPRIQAERKARYQASDARDELAADGFVYVIVHPKWENMVKIGESRDPNHRRDNGNTWYPDRGLKVHDAIYTPDRKRLEDLCHAWGDNRGYRLQGEWFEINEFHAVNMILKVQHDNTGV